MRERLQEILRLTSDDSFSHASRMVSIRKECEAALEELRAAEVKTGAGSGAKTGNPVSQTNPPATGATGK